MTDSVQDKINKILANLEKETGVKVNIDVDAIESMQDKMAEAQSVVTWFETNGANFVSKVCKWCNKEFLYSWSISTISYCSIRCMHSKLESIGLSWNPMKPASERWGRTRPAFISSEATELLNEFAETESRETTMRD